MHLTVEQQNALNFIAAYSRAQAEKCSSLIHLILYQSDIDLDIYTQTLSRIRQHARIALHFHPDRITQDKVTVSEGLLLTGKYKNQFETRISAGSLSATKSGNRDIWEEELFGGYYHSPYVPDNDRPKYGSLNLTLAPDGSSPRFGSCYFLLKPTVKERATFTYGDSYLLPREKGTIDHFNPIMAALLHDLFTRNEALGKKETAVLNFLNFINTNIPPAEAFPANVAFSRNLDFYIEAQVHGPILLERDVATLVADSSFKGTEVEKDFERISATYQIPVFWHPGFLMNTADFSFNFRGPKLPEIARRVAKNGIVNAFIIGCASHKILREPHLWQDLGNQEELIQLLKYLWHALIRFGKPLNSSGDL
ncbi:MAG: hypothetical protein JWQ14_2786 [Adhaeribacter sp.]|nr:hypothetical protein [Adhaeribacter sp.]